MTRDELAKAVDELRSLAMWARDSSHSYTYVAERDEYYFDAGDLGEQCISVYIEDEDEVPLYDVFENGPVSVTALESLVDRFAEISIPEPEVLLNDALAALLAGDERQAKLAVAIKAVLDYGTPEVAPFTTTTVTSAFAAPASVST